MVSCILKIGQEDMRTIILSYLLTLINQCRTLLIQTRVKAEKRHWPLRFTSLIDTLASTEMYWPPGAPACSDAITSRAHFFVHTQSASCSLRSIQLSLRFSLRPSPTAFPHTAEGRTCAHIRLTTQSISTTIRCPYCDRP